MTGLAMVEVEAPKCWPLAGSERQRCFLREFENRVSARGSAVFSSSILSVYGYSLALGEEKVALEALEKLNERVAKGSYLVLLTASPAVLAKRITRRLQVEQSRARNILEKELTVHITAQKYMVEAAEKIGLPIIDTSLDPPKIVAEKVLESLGIPASPPSASTRRLAGRR
jgi:thymidylate kinase